MIVIDSQVHAYEANTPQRPWHTVPNWPDHVTGDEMVAAMDKVGVDGAIFISAFSMYRYDASYALEVQRSHPGRFAIVKPVDPDDPGVAEVIADWKKMLGADWDKTYAASNTIYVARQNNVLFSVLAQFFGAEAINDRLVLIETINFTTTPDDMLTSLTRIIADRSVGALFFGNYYLMDYELMGGDARAAIIAETEKRGMKPFLPPAVPFGSKQWPTLITPGPGPTSLADVP